MLKPLAVLNIENSKSDSDLIARLLKKAGYKIYLERVESDAQMRAALKSRTWDIIISNYSLPLFDSLTALTLLHEEGLDIPFIAYAGVIGEEAVVNLMKAGAHDYLMRDNLTRLVPAVERELEYAKVRRERKHTEQALQQSEEKYRALFQNAQVGMYRSKLDGSEILAVNRKFCEIFGYSEEEMLGNPATIHWANLAAREKMVKKLRKAGSLHDYEVDIMTKSGAVRTCSVSAQIDIERGYLEGSVIDITKRKQAEEALHESEERFRVVF